MTYKKSQALPLVDEAISQRESGYNQIWVVFDYDADKDFDIAIEKAFEHGIECAFSNFQFEYWLLLHLVDKSGRLHSAELTKLLSSELLKRFEIKYKKDRQTRERVCKLLMPNILFAEEMAKKGYEMFDNGFDKKYSDWCSCTTVYKLTIDLRKSKGLIKR